MKKALLLVSFMVLFSAQSHGTIRAMAVNQALGRIWIANMVAFAYDYSLFQLAIGNNQNAINALTLITVGATLNAWPPGAVYEFSGLNIPNNLQAGSTVSIWYPGSLPGNAVPANLVDFLQYGGSGNPYESVAVAAGLWTTGDFITAPFPIVFTGGIFDYGSSFYTTGVLGVKELTAQNGLNVFPNPCTVSTTLVLPDGFGRNEPVTIEVFDSQGMLVRRLEEIGSWATVETKRLPGGMYFIEAFNAANETYKGRFVKW